jgi:hypothetical protein
LLGVHAGKYLTLEDAAIYINPKGMGILRLMDMPYKEYKNQITVIDYMGKDSFGKDKYGITYIPGVFHPDKPILTITETISSIDDIRDDQLDFMTLFLPNEWKKIKKLHFRKKLEYACGDEDPQESSEQPITHVILNTVTRVDIDLRSLENPTPSDTHSRTPI